MGMGGAFGGAMGHFSTPMGGIGLDLPPNIPRGHGRRHSVNVVNKTPGLGSISSPNPYAQDGYEDGFVPPQPVGHSRQGSRVDSSWRISEFVRSLFSLKYLRE